MPVQLVALLEELGIEADSAVAPGWNTLSNGALVRAAVEANFTALLTRDRLFGESAAQALNGSNPPTPTANLLTGLGIDEYFMRTDSNGAMSFLPDALGSTIALANSSGAIATQYTYEPFGKTTVSGSSNGNPYQFTGRENDGTGLYFYRARYYSPAFQRFIAQDPIGFIGGDANLYAYVLNSPTNWIDPRGRAIYPPGPHHYGPLLPISCSQLGGLVGGLTGLGGGAVISGFFPPTELVEPLLTGLSGKFIGLQFGDRWFGSTRLCRPSPPPNTCPVR